jgi:hypothetical protein
MDKKKALEIVQENGLNLEKLPDKFKKNKEIVLAAVTEDGSALEYTNVGLKKNKEIVLAAVKYHGVNLKYADESLKKNKEIVLAAVKTHAPSIEFADKNLKKDPDILEEYYSNTYWFSKKAISKEIKLQKKIFVNISKKKIYQNIHDKNFDIFKFLAEANLVPNTKNEIIKELNWMEQFIATPILSFDLKSSLFLSKVFNSVKKKKPVFHSNKNTKLEAYIGDIRITKNQDKLLYHKHGNGILFAIDGKRYFGEFKNNKTHGKGAMIYIDPMFIADPFAIPFGVGGILIGNWINGKLEGKAIWWENIVPEIDAEETFDLPSSERPIFYNLKFKNNKQIGKSLCEYADGSKQEKDIIFNDIVNLNDERF